MRIGLYGGSFNPIHIAHINLAEYAISNLSLDLLIFIPCYQSVDKPISEYESAKDRVKMIELVLPEKCIVSTYEIDLGVPVQSIKTIEYFRDLYKNDELFFLIGEDSLLGIHTWEGFRNIEKLVNLVVFRRKLSSSNFDNKFNLKLIWMNNELWDFSSKEVRNKGKLDMLDNKVKEYIKNHKIYNI
ncbi:nicotinate-nicotinamide nucleotide adenylyltransferase [Candidatus Mycoplasma haematobovis]|uniref:Probable nicotinate-nucleotide adenylyltransferase n=1 Tax=Candidatus Mycoplasma haematobovis TaxID=432608 RepID=A0A1A9QDY1_9MOLU|nr:nicotinate (nicotinamide) nucleotide adenylyltransferase [Candidatus Mycoplasma haematobovis]OAL10314.1 nicotinate-nicotinamide nucleotide adenylyltransferase [Candidatus Mycoplasma haematobovis]